MSTDVPGDEKGTQTMRTPDGEQRVSTLAAADLSALTDYQRFIYAAYAPITEPCPKHHVPAGAECATDRGQVPFCAPRKKLVAHLTEDQRIAAYAALVAARDRVRTDLGCAPLDPERHACREASGRAWRALAATS